MTGVNVSVFWRKTYPVEAVRLTLDNIVQVAIEIGADYSDHPNGIGQDRTTPVPMITFLRSRAFIGDWVARGVDGDYTFYTHEDFLKKFHTHAERMGEDERYAKIFELVKQAMQKQDIATHFQDGMGDMDLVAIQTVKKIIREL